MIAKEEPLGKMGSFLLSFLPLDGTDRFRGTTEG